MLLTLQRVKILFLKNIYLYANAETSYKQSVDNSVWSFFNPLYVKLVESCDLCTLYPYFPLIGNKPELHMVHAEVVAYYLLLHFKKKTFTMYDVYVVAVIF